MEWGDDLVLRIEFGGSSTRKGYSMGPIMLTLLSLLVGSCIIAGTIPSSRNNRRQTPIPTGATFKHHPGITAPAINDSLPRVSRHHWIRADLNRVLGVEDDYIEQISPSIRPVR
jgi:hypothetical protein